MDSGQVTHSPQGMPQSTSIGMAPPGPIRNIMPGFNVSTSKYGLMLDGGELTNCYAACLWLGLYPLPPPPSPPKILGIMGLAGICAQRDEPVGLKGKILYSKSLAHSLGTGPGGGCVGDKESP